MNSLLNMFGNMGGASSGSNGSAILMQAIGAAMRGESPQTFMKKLANQHPQLKKMNLDDLMGSAQQICQQNGVDVNEVKQQLDSVIDPMLPK
jgi:hypothetical protein